MADADGAETEVHSQPGSSLKRGDITCEVVVTYDLFADRRNRRKSRNCHKSKLFRYGNLRRFPFQEIAGETLGGLRFKFLRGQLFLPGTRIGGKDCIWCAVGFDYFAFFKDHLIFERVHRNASGLQHCACLPVTFCGIWLVVIVGENGFDLILSGDLPECLRRGGVVNLKG